MSSVYAATTLQFIDPLTDSEVKTLIIVSGLVGLGKVGSNFMFISLSTNTKFDANLNVHF